MRLCDDLADLCAIEGQTFERRPAPVAIGALLSEATDLVGSAARRQQVRIETRYAPNLPSLMLDQERLRRVLVHLIENALRRALPGGQISIKIEVSLEELTCTLADDGQPLSMDERARVFFGPFQLADHALADSDDSGLELYLSRRIIEAEKGHLWTPEEDDRGPRFQFIVPLTAA
jgi:NtrC-family two-component system sensor histidine kinase KinB